MKLDNQKGFSLIELLLVVTIIGIVAAVAVPNFQKGIRAAENGSTFSALRVISSAQVAFFSQNGRFGRLNEIHAIAPSIGTVVGDTIVRGDHVIEMTPVSPTDAELKDSFTVTATRAYDDNLIHKYELDETGEIRWLLP